MSFTVYQDFYITLRKQHQGLDSTPITTRQLESLIRLTEARARLELRETATKEDAEDVIEIMKYRQVPARYHRDHEIQASTNGASSRS
jgi:DNA replicative helicase MCM subunit Mcm2 (Cdc46/Mcm family)